MADTRKRNANWVVTDNDGRITQWDQCLLAVLMDVRDELQQLNRVFACPNFQGMPHTMKSLDRIARTISRKIPDRKRKAAKNA